MNAKVSDLATWGSIVNDRLTIHTGTHDYVVAEIDSLYLKLFFVAWDSDNVSTQ